MIYNLPPICHVCNKLHHADEPCQPLAAPNRSALELLADAIEMPIGELRDAARTIRDERKKIALLEKLKIIREGNTAILPTGEIVTRGTEGSMGYPTAQASPRVLRLTLKKKWFDMIASGEKLDEYRTPSEWIFSRLIGKSYDVVEFSNGYGKQAPKVVVKFCGWHQGQGRPEWGAMPNARYVVIRLGKVISKKNVPNNEQHNTK